jgi:hypothetical protein
MTCFQSRGLNKAEYCVVYYHGEGQRESEVYAGINKKIEPGKSFAVMGEHSILFYLKMEQMSLRQFEKQSGYKLWYQRMAHLTAHNIRESLFVRREWDS